MGIAGITEADQAASMHLTLVEINLYDAIVHLERDPTGYTVLQRQIKCGDI
jgi:hypothetical protein